MTDAEGRRGGEAMSNVVHTIKPYWHDGAWVFDDPQRGLWAKPFIARTREIVDQILRRAGLAPGQPFTVIFGDCEVPGSGHRFVLERVRVDREGHWYSWGGMEGLCPALVRYFDAAPERIHCQVTARRTPFSVFQAHRVEGLGGATSRPDARDVRPQAGRR
jgi:hypothetical protein